MRRTYERARYTVPNVRSAGGREARYACGMDAEQIVHDVAERVRAVIADAEERAAAIVRDAEEEAKGIRARAEEDARTRLDDVQRAFADLQGKLGGSPQGEVIPEPVTVPEPEPPDTPEPTPDPVPDPVPGPEPVPEPTPEPVPEPTPGEPPGPEPGEPAADGNGGSLSSDKAAARLVAMKMALDGASREEIDAHLAANYDVENREKLLDDVLARAKA
jgi:outer membrane biosynthesis protein TonB